MTPDIAGAIAEVAVNKDAIWAGTKALAAQIEKKVFVDEYVKQFKEGMKEFSKGMREAEKKVFFSEPANPEKFPLIDTIDIYQSNFGTIVVDPSLYSRPGKFTPVSSATCKMGVFEDITLVEPWDTPFGSRKPFRAPKLIQMAPAGDVDRWLWVMEPEQGWIVGKAFSITHKELARAKNVSTYHKEREQEAYRAMIYRLGYSPRWNVPEGSLWEAFL